MAEKPQADIREKGHAPDKPGTDVEHAKGHCEHCEDHAHRIGLIETLVGLGSKPQPGVAKEETAHKESSVNRERKRH